MFKLNFNKNVYENNNVKIGFDSIKQGKYDGNLIVNDLGWVHFSIFEELGIESLIGVKGFNDEQHFYDFVINKTGFKLTDWEVISVPLYKSKFINPIDNSAKTYSSWRLEETSDAIITKHIIVFALRHKSFKSKLYSDFCVKRQYSYAKEIWNKLEGDRRFTLNAMNEIVKIFFVDSAGFSVDCKVKGLCKTITWPTSDFLEALNQIKKLKTKGYKDLHVTSQGVGLSLECLNGLFLKNLKYVYRNNDENLDFITMIEIAQDMESYE